MLDFVTWAALCPLAIVALFFAQRPIRKRSSVVLNIIIFIIKAFLMVLFALLAVTFDSILSWGLVGLTYAIYIAFLGDLLFDCIRGIVYVVRRDTTMLDKSLAASLTLSLVCGLGVMAYGGINSQIVRKTTRTYYSSKLTSEHNFVFLSDVHVGGAQSHDTLRKVCERIDKDNPDFVVLVGDITDEYTTKQDMQNTYELFGKLNAPVYFVYGNHDRQYNSHFTDGRKYSEEELRDAITNNGLTILKDEYQRISDDLMLIGREDLTAGKGRKDSQSLRKRNPDANAFLLAAEHQPYNTADTVALGPDLQVSGHSHGGQLFPLRTLYTALGYESFGEYQHGDTTLLVSSGESAWKLPVRTESPCEYVHVTLKPQ